MFEQADTEMVCSHRCYDTSEYGQQIPQSQVGAGQW